MPRKTGERRGRVRKMSLPKQRILKKEIPLHTVKEWIVEKLYTLSIIDDNIDIKDIEFDPWFVDPVQIRVKTDKPEGGTSIKLNGKELH